MQLAYAIGVAQPLSIRVDCFGTGKYPEPKIVEIIRALFDLRPRGIIERLDLLKPVYKRTARYGHFGRPDFTWERLDMVSAIQQKLGAAVAAGR